MVQISSFTIRPVAIILNYKEEEKRGGGKRWKRRKERSERSNKSMDLKDYEFVLEKASIHSWIRPHVSPSRPNISPLNLTIIYLRTQRRNRSTIIELQKGRADKGVKWRATWSQKLCRVKIKRGMAQEVKRWWVGVGSSGEIQIVQFRNRAREGHESRDGRLRNRIEREENTQVGRRWHLCLIIII